MECYSNKCNINFETQYAFVNKKEIHISEYNNSNLNIKCKKGHELEYVNPKSRKSYFRHKNKNDTGGEPMTKWHSEWQGNFPHTEIFFKKMEKQIKNRIADVELKPYNLIIEFQHSKITLDEVATRKADYLLHNYKVIWIIDGNSSINIKELSDSKRIYLEFTDDLWKYKSFTCYEYIFIDINEKIYKIYPNDIKSDMIDVDKPIDKDEFIKLLKENNSILFNKYIPKQCNLYIKQQGAGNGKTYGLIQQLETDEFSHYGHFIIVTKQHSAKQVIYSEFEKQIKQKQLKHLEIIESKLENKKYIILFKNKKLGSLHEIIIATIDSLMYNLGNKNVNGVNKFEEIVNSIVDGWKFGSVLKYAGSCIKLNKEMCLIIDETQDLSINYAKAIYQIMRNKYIDGYIVGDKLQSLVYNDKNNAFVYLMDNEFSHVNKKLYNKTNICRRFTDNQLIEFVNNMVPFDEYRLPKIEKGEIRKQTLNSLNIIEGKNINYSKLQNNDKEIEKFNKEINNIMEKYKKEVEENNYKPNDFLIITPFTTNNPLCNAIETSINQYWNNKYNENNEFKQYAIFHKSDEGTSIDLTISEESTRIVSIHTSKGDGRNIVFVIGLNESSIIRFSKEKNNLIYNSMIHVALTRMKKKLYIRLEQNGDDIHQRIYKITLNNHSVKPTLDFLNKKIKYNNIITLCKSNEIFETIKTNIIELNNNPLINDIENKKYIIDMGHHLTRYCSMTILFYLKIIQKQKVNNGIKKQITAIFHKIIKKPYIENTNDWTKYNHYIMNNELCILKFSNQPLYDKYFNIIKNLMENIQFKVKNIINNTNILFLCPLESVILFFMIEICSSGIYSTITIYELYNILDIYSKSFNNNLEGHKDCDCKKYFNNSSINEKSKLFDHYQELVNLNKIYDKVLNNMNDVNWLINHSIKLNGCNMDYVIYKKFQMLGYDDKNVYIIYLKPQFNNLNYNDTVVDSIFDTYIINRLNKKEENMCDYDSEYDISENCSNDSSTYNKKEEDIKKFAGKTIKTIVFSLDKKESFEFKWSKDMNIYLTELITSKLYNYFTDNSCYIYHYYEYYFEKYKNETNIKIIKRIIDSFSKYKSLPHFVIKFFENIECELRNNYKSLAYYNDKNEFIKSLNNDIQESINDYIK